ncbi:MAG TPA: hypothetical protein VMT58_08140, partial [Candidatus Binataceae bacterium]|nr:hypothetical protein [Candidatus Binataceae bacterium]
MSQPWKRFGLAIPAATVFCALLIVGFSIVLIPRVTAPEHREAVEVRLVQVEPEIHGLQGNGKPKLVPQPIPPAPRAEPRRHSHAHPHPAPVISASAPVATSPNGIAVPLGVLHPLPPPAAAEVEGEGGGGGIGTDTIGARAVY